MLNSSDLTITDFDYARLRALGGKTLLVEELDHATVIPQERVPGRMVTMRSRLIYRDEKTG